MEPKNELLQGNYPNSLTQPKITKQRPFELTGIEYNQIKDKILRMECVAYNTDIGRNIMNVGDIEEFVNV